jgi:peptidoglycan hydrolase-like protein with peptidoglycan-binding domain
MLCLAFPGLSATRKTRRPAPHKASSAAALKKPGTTVKRASSGKSRKGVRSRKRRPSWRTAQMAPTPERYKEIQQALIDRGYLQGPASGVWGPDCSQALKRYQQDQNLEATGKLDSLSLITLGLGPRREPIGSSALITSPLPGSGGRAMQ